MKNTRIVLSVTFVFCALSCSENKTSTPKKSSPPAQAQSPLDTTSQQKSKTAVEPVPTIPDKKAPPSAPKERLHFEDHRGTAPSPSQASNAPPQGKVAQVRDQLNKDAKAAEKPGLDTEKVAKTESETQWASLLEYITKNGEAAESMTGIYLSVTDSTTSDRMQPRISNMISVIGGYDSHGQFGFSRVEAVWENWTVNGDGNMDMDQWSFLLSRDGNIARMFHYHMIKKQNDTVLLHRGVEFTPEEGQKKWDELKQQWFKKVNTDRVAPKKPAQP